MGISLGEILGRRMGKSASRFRDDACVDTSLLRHPGLVPGLIRAVIPDLFRDLFEKAVISTQPPLDVSMIPDIAGGDSGTTGEGPLL